MRILFLLFQQPQVVSSGIDAQIKILTFVMGAGALLVGALITYLKISTTSSINAAKLDINQKIQTTKDDLMRDIKAEFARKEFIDAKLSDLDRRLTKTETKQDAISLTTSGITKPASSET